MGYTTDFSGEFKLNKPLDPETHEFLKKFSETRRMARKVDEKYGVEGEFYVESTNNFGQDHEPNIIHYNRPPSTQPSLWCQWTPNEEGTAIQWDDGEKFYEYVPWLKYINTNFLEPKGYKLNGSVEWQGEDADDFGVIKIENNKIFLAEGKRKLGEFQEYQGV